MSKTNDGGPAFPVFPETETGHAAAFRGMTLRDYFAAAALTGLMGFTGKIAGANNPLAPTRQEMAEAAFNAADAMLAERERGQQ